MEPPLWGPEVPLVVRSPEERFAGLASYPFNPRYAELRNPYGESQLRMHYVDEGEGPVVLLVHGEPTWSYLYRKMVPVLVAAGLRVVAVDLIGFGRSDKLTSPAHYTFAAHVAWVQELIDHLDLGEITLVCQDWGGPIGLAVLAREPERFARVVAGNTMLHTAGSELAGRLAWPVHESAPGVSTVSAALLDWMHYTHRAVDFRASHSVAVATARPVPAEVLAAYDAPFPTSWHEAGMRQFPLLIPVTTSDAGAAINRATWEALAEFDRPFLTLFGDSDPATRGWERIFQERVPGARGQPHRVLGRTGHFWPEDSGEEAAELIVGWLGADRSAR